MRLNVFPLLAVACLASACATGRAVRSDVPGDDDEWVFTGSEDEVAAVQLGRWLAEHGISVLSVAHGSVNIADGGLRTVLQPKLGEGRELDRIVALRFFEPKDEWKGSKELREFANGLNVRYNIGAFYVDEDGDLAFQTFITFIDHVSWAEVRGFMDWMKLTFSMLMGRESELLDKYMK
jgi:hypothetical protein